MIKYIRLLLLWFLFLWIPLLISDVASFIVFSHDLLRPVSSLSLTALMLFIGILFIKKIRLIYLIGGALILFPTILFSLYLIIYKAPIYGETYYTLFESPFAESAEYILTHSAWYIWVIILLLFVYFFTGLYYLPKIELPKKLKIILLFILLIPAVYTWFRMSEKNINYIRANNISIDFYCSIHDFLKEKDRIKHSFKKENNVFNHINRQSDRYFINKNPIHFVVIGESTTSTHMSLFGYKRITNPKLQNLKDSMRWTVQAISSHTHTIESLKDVLGFSSDNFLPAAIALKKAGYYTVWLSNQRSYGVFESLITAMANYCDTVIFTTNHFSAVNQSYDEVLIKKAELLLTLKKPIIIFIHLIGTHEAYQFRYPPTFNKFEDDKNLVSNFSLTKNEINVFNKYDNAVLYNDFIVSEFFKIAMQQKRPTSMVYFSDHGEEVFHQVRMQGHAESISSTDMYKVPLLFYRNYGIEDSGIKPGNNFQLKNLFQYLYKEYKINEANP